MVDLSCPEHSPAGQFLGRLYYDTPIMDVLTRDERNGSPNNGMEHTLRLQLPQHDVQAFLDLIREVYSTMKGYQEFLNHCKSRVPFLQ